MAGYGTRLIKWPMHYRVHFHSTSSCEAPIKMFEISNECDTHERAINCTTDQNIELIIKPSNLFLNTSPLEATSENFNIKTANLLNN